jgi:hypothetical protein
VVVRKLTNFWNTLDLLSRASLSAIEWRGGHQGEWSIIAPLLINTGSRSGSIACPSGAGENCPRKVVSLTDGGLVAECQDVPATCDRLELTPQDILIQRLDTRKFSGLVAKALSLNSAGFKQWPEGLFCIGTRDVAAGQSVPVFGLFQGGSQPSRSVAALEPLAQSAQPQLLLVPTEQTLSTDQKRQLQSLGTEVRTFDDALLADDQDNVHVSAAVSVLLGQLETTVRQALQTGNSGLVWPLPPDAAWAKMKIVFQSEEVINVSYNGETKRYEPAQLDMVKATNGKPTNQWTMLKSIAIGRGTIPFPSDPKLQKQKQALSKKLMAAFGINADPIKVKDGSYVALYVTNADGLKQGRQGAHQRNFVDDD